MYLLANKPRSLTLSYTLTDSHLSGGRPKLKLGLRTSSTVIAGAKKETVRTLDPDVLSPGLSVWRREISRFSELEVRNFHNRNV